MSANPSPVERQRVEGMLDEVARHLDADQFEDAAGRGDAIGLDQAVTIALRWSPG
jgi:hypothetical protein